MICENYPVVILLVIKKQAALFLSSAGYFLGILMKYTF